MLEKVSADIPWQLALPSKAISASIPIKMPVRTIGHSQLRTKPPLPISHLVRHRRTELSSRLVRRAFLRRRKTRPRCVLGNWEIASSGSELPREGAHLPKNNCKYHCASNNRDWGAKRERYAIGPFTVKQFGTD